MFRSVVEGGRMMVSDPVVLGLGDRVNESAEIR